jgi:hypothetical protein
MHKTSQKVDDTLFLGVLAAITLTLLLWTSLVVYDIKQDVKEIKITVNDMHQTYSEMLRPQADKVDTDISAKSLD